VPTLVRPLRLFDVAEAGERVGGAARCGKRPRPRPRPRRTPNLAARLQGIVTPNTIVIAEGTRCLIGRGIPAPVRQLGGVGTEFGGKPV
jgi:hypothetical protein